MSVAGNTPVTPDAEPCDTCTPAFPGILIGDNASSVGPGVVSVERCDACMVYEGDLDAAWALATVAGGRVYFWQSDGAGDHHEFGDEPDWQRREFDGVYNDDDCIAFGTVAWIEGIDLAKLERGPVNDEPEIDQAVASAWGFDAETLAAMDPELRRAVAERLKSPRMRALAGAAGPALLVEGRGPRVFKVLDLSTAHLPENVMNGPDGPLPSFEGVIAYEHGEYGYLLWVPEDPQEHADDYPNPADKDVCSDEGVPAEVLAVQLYARSLDCDYVLFDRDADVDDALPVWKW